MMIGVQRTKRFGLQKLKKIAGAPNPNWFVSPHVVITANQKLTAKKINNMPRLLTRTDEIGRNCREYEPYHMPRDDVHMITMDGKSRRPSEEAHWATQSVRKLPKSVLIIHPTRKRKNIRWTGSVVILPADEKHPHPRATIRLAKNPSSEQIHRSITPNIELTIPLVQNEIQINQLKDIFFEVHPQALGIAKRIVELINKGIKTRQINTKRPFTEISFLTWKTAPEKLELYDLIERRTLQESQMKKVNKPKQ